MVVKSQIKFIKSLQQKKNRIINGLFVAEGRKMVYELLNSDFGLHSVYSSNAEYLSDSRFPISPASNKELSMMSSLKNASDILGVFEIPIPKPVNYSEWVVALDDIQDPGNLGTIIRLCDWFNISNLLCSKGTVDCYNPKALQATMGSITRVNVVYKDLNKEILQNNIAVYGTFMQGKSIYKTSLPKDGMLLLGNEGHGISQKLQAIVHQEVSIPQYGSPSAESLNVGSAAAIFLGEIRRQNAS